MSILVLLYEYNLIHDQRLSKDFAFLPLSDYHDNLQSPEVGYVVTH